jgi:Lamin Tail Domain
MYDPSVSGDFPGEWIELYNRGTTDTVNLKNWNFKDQSTPVQTFTIGVDLLIGPGQYRVLGQGNVASANGGVNVNFVFPTSFFFTNTGDAIIMTDPSGVERGRVVYGTNGFVNVTGASISLKSPELDTNVGTNWCASSTVWAGATLGDKGTPGAANDCPTPNSLIVINEIMYDPGISGDTPGEWFELFNRGTTTTVNLKNWNFKDQSSNLETFTIATDLFIGPGQYKVLGQSTVAALNGGVAVDYVFPSGGTGFRLGNNGDEIIMTDPSGVERGRVEYGTTGFVDPSGASIALKSPELDTNVGANWCTSSTVWPGSTVNDKGTPGAANVYTC